MKKIIFILSITLLAFSANAQVNFHSNTVNDSENASALGTNNTANGTTSFASGHNSVASGNYSTAMGHSSTASGLHSAALGSFTTAEADGSIAIGPYAKTHSGADFSFAVGNLVETTASGNFVLGIATDYNNPLINNIPNSLMIGFQSDIPTFFVGTSNGSGTVGKIGVGTTTPTTLLDVNGTLNVEDAVSLRDNLTVIGEFSLNGAASFGDNLSIAGELDVTDNTTFGNNLSVNNKLTTHQLQLTTGAGTNKILTSDDNGNALWTPAEDIVPESIWTKDNENIYVQNANVGIGTDSPLGKLHIDMGTNKPSIICTSTTNTHSDATDIKFITDASNGNTIFSTYTSNWAPSYNWQCGTNGKGTYTAMTLELKSWSTKLRLHGNLLCEQVEVMKNVPNSDFVFEEDYRLMSLQELETYVSDNHHLPEIPSAAEFKENGYNMNDMDDLLLRKVEELTLYIIALEKKVNSLENNQK